MNKIGDNQICYFDSHYKNHLTEEINIYGPWYSPLLVIHMYPRLP